MEILTYIFLNSVDHYVNKLICQITDSSTRVTSTTYNLLNVVITNADCAMESDVTFLKIEFSNGE